MQVIDFIEQRIGNTSERHARGDQYDAIPFELSHAFESIRSSPAYVDVLRRVRDWMLREDVWFRHEASRILKALAGGLQTPLYGVLMEWVESDDIRKLKEVACLLHEFNVGGPFHLTFRIARRMVTHREADHRAYGVPRRWSRCWGPSGSFTTCGHGPGSRSRCTPAPS